MPERTINLIILALGTSSSLEIRTRGFPQPPPTHLRTSNWTPLSLGNTSRIRFLNSAGSASRSAKVKSYQRWHGTPSIIYNLQLESTRTPKLFLSSSRYLDEPGLFTSHGPPRQQTLWVQVSRLIFDELLAADCRALRRPTVRWLEPYGANCARNSAKTEAFLWTSWVVLCVAGSVAYVLDTFKVSTPTLMIKMIVRIRCEYLVAAY